MRTALALVMALASCKDSRPMDRFAAASGQDTFDHAKLDTLLRTYVDDRGMVNYSEWKKKDLSELDAYLDMTRAARPSQLSRSEAVAFWTNVYNALTIRAILEFYPLKSIQDKVNRVVGYNVWDDYKIKVEGAELSLNDIEHKILRKMGEPRIHFALVCAAKGCPRLRNAAYAGERLDEQLADDMRHFFSQARNYRLDRPEKKVYLSSILDWYGKDFGKNEKERLANYARALGDDDRAFVEKNELGIEFLDYDWSLNQQ